MSHTPAFRHRVSGTNPAAPAPLPVVDGRARLSHGMLLAGVSLIALLASNPAVAGNRFQATTATTANVATTSTATGGSSSSTSTAQVTGDLVTAAHSFKVALSAQAAAARAAMNAGTNSVTLADGSTVNVTDGLSSNGLVVDPRVTFDNSGSSNNINLWSNIGAPVQTTAGGQTTVTLTQTSQRAIATWYKFNVGSNTTLYFNQSAGNTANGNDWVVLNRIDATGVPSAILGTIKAEGTVLVINPNGIVFGAGSQINVHSLIASAMDLNGTSGVYDATGNYVAQSGTVKDANGNDITATFYAPADETTGNKDFLQDGLYNYPSSYTDSSGTSITRDVSSWAVNSGKDSSGDDLSSTTLKNYGVTVEKGATISTLDYVSGSDNGGLVALIGPQVTNAGLIETSAGEIALAAGSSVFLSEPDTDNHETAFLVATVANTANHLSGVNGLITYDPSTSLLAVSGLTANTADGVLSSERGNITLAGTTVGQDGMAEATTSITRPGSITITASGDTAFGAGSTTAIVSAENGETIIEGSIADSYTAPSIAIVTTNLDVASGSLIVAPSATMTVDSYQVVNGSSPDPTGRVLVEDGSIIDLGGMAATASVSDYLYTFKVTANDVADTPDAAALIGQTVTIDLRLSGTRADGESWVGSPLFAATGAGYLGNVAYSLDEVMTSAGSLKIGASGAFTDVITTAGSLINLSGGAIAYTGGMVTTTNVRTVTGAIVNIGSADPFVDYAGLPGSITVNHPHWNVSETFSNRFAAAITSSYYDEGYTDGLSAGAVGVSAVNPLLEGFIEGDTTTGSRQRELSVTSSAASPTSPDDLPTGASLTISLAAASNASPPDSVVLADAGDTAAAMAGALSGVTADTGTVSLPTANGGSTIYYSTDLLTAENLGSLTIKGAYALSMTAGSSLTVRPGGSITLSGVTEIDGSLTAHGGSISLTGSTYPASSPVAAQGDYVATALTIGSTAVLDVSGLWVNDGGLTADTMTGDAWINGGSISLVTDKSSAPVGSSVDNGNGTSTYQTVQDETASIVLAAGSVIDLSSGGYVTAAGALKTASGGLPAGNGGSLTLQTYAGSWNSDTGAADGFKYPLAPTTANAATVVFGGTIYAAGLNQGGTLTLQVPSIIIDGTATAISTNGGALTLPTSFFTQGFSTYKLVSTYGDITVTDNTIVGLKQQNYLISAATLPATGAEVRDFASLGYALDGERQPVDLSLTQQAFGGYQGATAADPQNPAGIVIGAGASIVGDPAAAITLAAAGPVTVFGSIIAHGGSIAISSDDTSLLHAGAYTAAQDVWIGADAVLDVSGVYVRDLAETAYNTGSVLDGGSISISSDGAIIALKGSTFDIQGASATIQEPSGSAGQFSSGYASQVLWSNGGTLTLSSSSAGAGAASLFFAGTIEAAGGAPSASGGTLNIGAALEGYNSILIAQSGDVTLAFESASAPATATELASLMSGLALTTTSTTNNTIGTNTTETFTIQKGLPSGLFTGYPITVSDGNGDTMTGTIKSYDPSTGNLVIYTTNSTGQPTATSSAWTISIPNSAAFITTDTINSAGLDSVSLSGATIAFSGPVNLKVPDALYLNGNIVLLAAGVTPSSGLASYAAPAIDATTLSAGYIRWLLTSGSEVLPSAGDGTLNLVATDQIDLAGVISASNADTVNFTVIDGDIRFLPPDVSDITGSGYILNYTGGSVATSEALLVPGDLTMTAREIYPATATTFLLASLGEGGTISFKSDGVGAYTPYSANGVLLVDAATITQGGALVAPLGAVILGLTSGQSFGSAALVDTASVTLGAGSVTSTSASGVVIPYGTTTDLEDWLLITSATSGATTPAQPLANPSKVIVLAGASVATDSGAVINEAGGGDVYATEFIAGTGGSRNLLATTTSTTAQGTNQTVYALVPAYEAKVAAYDSTIDHVYDTSFSSSVAAGAAVILPGGNGVAAGTYVLLPAMYATLPGAYRVVLVNPDIGVATNYSTVAADGSIFTTGVLGNAITGARSSATALFELQSNSVWSKYSEIATTYGNNTFSGSADRLARDAGQLIIAATSSLTLDATNEFAAAAGGRGGEVDITGSNIVVAASDQLPDFGTVSNGVFTPNTPYSSYIFLDADQLSDLGVESLLIGGYRSISSSGTLITVTAGTVEVATDAGHALSGPEILIAAGDSGSGIVVDAGSVIAAKGAVSSASSAAYVIGAASAVSGEGAFLRVSDGGADSVIRNDVSSYDGSLAVGAGVTLTGASLTLDSSGAITIADTAALSARNYDLGASTINVGGGSSGLVLSAGDIAAMAGATTVTLRGLTGITFYDGASLGDSADPIGTLTLDAPVLTAAEGSAGTAITATNIVFQNTRGTTETAAGGTGTLSLDALGTLTFGAGTKVTSGFGAINVTAGSEILFSGTGSLDTDTAAVTLTAPFLVVDTGASQSLTTSGTLTILPATGAPLSLAGTVYGGSLTLTAASIADSGTIVAQAGTVTLEATATPDGDGVTGDVILSGSAAIDAPGTTVALNDEFEFTPGGTVKLISDKGDVTLGSGTVIGVSASGNGYAGVVGIQATSGTATLSGSLNGGAAYNDLGGTFILSANAFGGGLPIASGFTGAFEVELGQGDITIAQGQTLTANTVLLSTNQGTVTIDGTIDASGQSAGTISLYGVCLDSSCATTGGVVIGSDARLYARYQADDPADPAYSVTASQNGGTIILGTSGKPNPDGSTDAAGYGAYNSTYGYENVSAANSGSITVASGAVLDVSGGSSGTGGTVLLRAPLLEDGSVNVSVASGVTITGASAKTLEAYAVWSTTDTSQATNNPTQYFDGIVDPAGWYTSSGALEPGSFTDAGGNAVANWSSSGVPSLASSALSSTGTSTSSSTATTSTTTTTGYSWDGTTFTTTTVTTVTNTKTSATTTTTVVTQVTNSGTLVYTNGALTSSSASDAVTYDADVENYLLTFYDFTPSTYNTAHQAFYAYNPTTGNAGTLMGFVQNPLSGAAAATTAATTASNAGLTLVPGIELDNPSSTNNSGNITVVTNWNLGAMDSSGNLVYRYNGNAPILTLRAKNDIDINASITDGFASSPVATPAAGSVDYSSASLLYNANWYNFNLSLIQTGDLTLNGSNTFQSPALPTVLGYSASDPYDQYYYCYAEYEGEYTFYYQRMLGDNSGYFESVSLGGTTVPSDIANAYNYAQTLYSSTDLTKYSSYLAAYDVYAQEYWNWSLSVNAATLPIAPSAPPAVSLAVTYTYSIPANNGPAPVATPSVQSPVLSMDLAADASSSSYRIVAGANFMGANPVAVGSAPGADVVIDGHISYTDPQEIGGSYPTISIGTVVRTGTGSIDIAASGNFILADSTAPGAVYTAGIATATPADFTAPAVPSGYTGNPNGLVSTPTWASGGGSVTVIVGGDIDGGETASLDGAANWSSWYYHAFAANSSGEPFASSATVTTQQTAAWVNYSTYADGIGALGGGNVTLKAGGTISDIIVSLPEGIVVAGGMSAVPTETEIIYGGGNLMATAANMVGSAVLVGDGIGVIRVNGSITENASGNGLELAVQNGSISVIAGGDIALSGISDPARLANYTNSGGDGTPYTLIGALPGFVSGITSTLGSLGSGYFTSYSEDSGISLTSVSGDVTIAASSSSSSVMLAPATLIVDAIGGDIATSGSYPGGTGIDLLPSASGTLTLLAGGSIDLIDTSGTSTTGSNYTVTMLDGTSSYYVNPLGTPTPTVLSQALHADDDGSVLIYAGNDLYGSYNLIEQAKLYAGRDMINVQFTGQNNRPTDVTSIIASRDILADSIGYGTTAFTLYGPGGFLIEAGRNLGPFNSSASSSGGGIFTVGDGGNCTTAVCNISASIGGSTTVRPYLPIAGADLIVLYGVGSGIDYTDAIAKYVDTTTGGINFIGSITSQLESTLDTLASQATSSAAAAAELNALLASWNLPAVSLTSGLLASNTSFTLTDAQALSIFQTKLSTTKQDLLVDRAFLDLLTQVATDYSDRSSAYYQQYARAYQAIATLFPAGYGYTDNSSAGGTNGASSTVTTGTLRMARSLIETQTGGDINILGPGGSLYVGSNSYDKLDPDQQGILTLQGGSVNIYSDQTVMVDQSRIFTEQGGDVDIFSANGDINAGEGEKSKAAYPKLTLVCDTDGYCRVSPAGLVTGAGIGALVTLPGQDPTKSNMSLAAPHGTVDAGAAGIRVGGNINIVALQVLNAFNISVGGTAIGVPQAVAPAVNLGALAADTAAGQASATAEAAARSSRQAGPRAADMPSIITVEVIGYGGADQPQEDDPRRKSRDRQGQNDPAGAIRVIGYGRLDPDTTPGLTDEEKRRLSQP